MKILTLEELRKIEASKLTKEINEAKNALFEIRFSVKNGQSKSVHQIAQYRKYIAKIQTILKEKNS